MNPGELVGSFFVPFVVNNDFITFDSSCFEEPARKNRRAKMMTDSKLVQIKKFWQGRAGLLGSRPQATLEESDLRKLEERTIARFLAALSPRRVLDIGCGSGCSTSVYAGTFPTIQFVGVDNCPEMIDLARSRKRLPNCRFQVADVLQPESLPEKPFEMIVSQRCLQNLPDYGYQAQAIRTLQTWLAPQGKMLLVEGSKQGVLRLQAWRERCKKPAWPNIEPWYNCFLDEDLIQRDFSARIIPFASSYFFLTRLIHQRLSCLARIVPAIGNFGYVKAFVCHAG